MKTIQINDDMYNELVSLAKEMTTQDMRCTRMPHMFQIQEEKEVLTADGYGDSIWINPEGGELRNEEVIKEFILQELKDTHNDFRIGNYESEEELNRAIENYIEENIVLEDYLGEHEDNWYQVEVTMEKTYKNTFLTAKACQEHIDKNHYHYNKPKVYLNHAWRNPEMELVSKFLCSLVGKEIHT